METLCGGALMKRRVFLRASAGAALGLGELAFLSKLSPVSAAEARVDRNIVRFDPSIEPLVRLIEDTPRERLLEEIASQIQKGVSYRETLAALLLAGIRNVEPRPSVGFKFHAVLVVHSAHLVAQGSPEAERWLPLFWALDHFKGSQAADVREGDWTMRAAPPNGVPPAPRAAAAWSDAMDRWDETDADAAAAGLARSLGPEDVFEILVPYAVRDLRSIGHKAIYVANGWRTLETIGWQHAEPVLRSLAYALNAREGSDPLKGDDRADRPWRRNLERAGRVRAEWQSGKIDSGATAELLAVSREGNEDETSERVVALLNRGISPDSIWDGLLCGAAELLMRSPGILTLHAVTTTNAIRYLYERSRRSGTRLLLLLQNAAFLPFYRTWRRGDGSSGERIDALAPADFSTPREKAVDAILAEIGRDNGAAARQVLAYLGQNGNARELLDAANRLVFLKGNDSHDYKLSAAVLEDYFRLSPPWRDRYLAASVFWLNGSGAPENELVHRARRALVG